MARTRGEQKRLGQSTRKSGERARACGWALIAPDRTRRREARHHPDDDEEGSLRDEHGAPAAAAQPKARQRLPFTPAPSRRSATGEKRGPAAPRFLQGLGRHLGVLWAAILVRIQQGLAGRGVRRRAVRPLESLAPSCVEFQRLQLFECFVQCFRFCFVLGCPSFFLSLRIGLRECRRIRCAGTNGSLSVHILPIPARPSITQSLLQVLEEVLSAEATFVRRCAHQDATVQRW